MRKITIPNPKNQPSVSNMKFGSIVIKPEEIDTTTQQSSKSLDAIEKAIKENAFIKDKDLE